MKALEDLSNTIFRKNEKAKRSKLQYEIFPRLVIQRRKLLRQGKVLGDLNRDIQNAEKQRGLAKKLINIGVRRIEIWTDRIFLNRLHRLQSQKNHAEHALAQFRTSKPDLKAALESDYQEKINRHNVERQAQFAENASAITEIENQIQKLRTENEVTKEQAGFPANYPNTKIRRFGIVGLLLSFILGFCDAAVMYMVFLKTTGTSRIESIGMVTGSIMATVIIPEILAKQLANVRRAAKRKKVSNAFVSLSALLILTVVLVVFVGLRWYLLTTANSTGLSEMMLWAIAILPVTFPMLICIVRYKHLKGITTYQVLRSQAKKLTKMEQNREKLRKDSAAIRKQGLKSEERIKQSYLGSLANLKARENQLEEAVRSSHNALRHLEAVIESEKAFNQNTAEKVQTVLEMDCEKSAATGHGTIEKRPIRLRQLFRILFPILLLLSLLGCEESKNSYALVALDISEPELYDASLIPADAILKQISIDTMHQSHNGGRIEVMQIHDALYSPKTSIIIAAQDFDSNPYARKEYVRSQTRVLDSLLSINPQRESQESQIFLPICNALNNSERAFHRNCLFILSDFLEYNTQSNFYQLDEDNFAEEKDKLQSQGDLPGLHSWNIFLLPLDNPQYRAQSHLALKLFSEIFSDAGASVSIGL